MDVCIFLRSLFVPRSCRRLSDSDRQGSHEGSGTGFSGSWNLKVGCFLLLKLTHVMQREERPLKQWLCSSPENLENPRMPSADVTKLVNRTQVSRRRHPHERPEVHTGQSSLVK